MKLTTFVCDPKFSDVKSCLEGRGLVAKTNLDSLDFDISWRNLQNTKFHQLQSHRIINHLQNAENISHKATLARLLFTDKNALNFYPRSYDLRVLSHCKALVHDLALSVAIGIIDEALKKNEASQHVFDCIEFCKYEQNYNDDSTYLNLLRKVLFKPKQNYTEKQTFTEKERKQMHMNCTRRTRQQLILQDVGGIYLIKPAGGSCGDGISCISSIEALISQAQQRQYKVVVQKYIERPLLVRGRKFDIRQWILITDTNPLTVYGFSRCYARFASESWNLNSLHNRFAHLCNFSVQKFSQQQDITADDFPPFQNNMWTCQQLAAFIDTTQEPGTFDSFVRPQLRQIAIAVATTAKKAGMQKRAYGFEWLGLDIMLADDLSAWLLEANVSPDVSHSTPVTSALVPAATIDALSLLLDHGAAFSSDTPRQNDKSPPHPRWELWYQESATKSSISHPKSSGSSSTLSKQYALGSTPIAVIEDFGKLSSLILKPLTMRKIRKNCEQLLCSLL